MNTKTMARSALVLLLLSILSHTAFATTTAEYRKATDSWAQVLDTYVDSQGRIDFASLANEDWMLKEFVAFIRTTSPTSHPELFPTREDVLAFHINAYNALAMNGVIERGIPNGFTSFFKRLSFFKFHSVTVGGEETSLYDYENDVIRPLGEPRLHFALNCMVKACPRLPTTPYTAGMLDKQLESATIEFFGQPQHFRVSDNEKTVYVSEILDFYTEDFVASGAAEDLPNYINRYLEEPIRRDYRISFIDYDWRINQQPR